MCEYDFFFLIRSTLSTKTKMVFLFLIFSTSALFPENLFKTYFKLFKKKKIYIYINKNIYIHTIITTCKELIKKKGMFRTIRNHYELDPSSKLFVAAVQL